MIRAARAETSSPPARSVADGLSAFAIAGAVIGRKFASALAAHLELRNRMPLRFVLSFSVAMLLAVFAASRPGRGGGLSKQHHSHRDRLLAGRRLRRCRPRRRRQARGEMGQAGHRREQDRRAGQSRDGLGREGSGRRLHADRRSDRQCRGQSVAVQGTALRHEGIRAGLDDRRDRECAGGEFQAAGKESERADRARQEQGKALHVFVAGRRQPGASGRRIAGACDRRRYRAHPLSRPRARAE